LAGRVQGIHYENKLGGGITAASVPFGEDGSGSWCTCQIGAQRSPPADVCHLQFKAKIAFKQVWCPGTFRLSAPVGMSVCACLCAAGGRCLLRDGCRRGC